MSSRNGGLYDVLNLRLVCKTTQSWVDNLSAFQAKRIFFKSQVKLNCSTSTSKVIESFVKYPPPFKLHSLSLTLDIPFQSLEFTLFEKSTWDQFYVYWNSRLESLVLNVECPYSTKNVIIKKRMTSLLLDNYQRIKFLKLSLQTARDLKWLKKFLELKRNDKECLIKICLELIKEPIGPPPIMGMGFHQHTRDFCSEEDKNILRATLNSIFESKSQIEINLMKTHRMDSSWILTRIKQVLTREQYETFLNSVTKVSLSANNELMLPTRSVMEHCPNLQTLVTSLKFPEEANLMQFPNSLRKIKIHTGFIPVNSFPESLKVLEIKEFLSTPNRLINSMTDLSVHCPNVETLNIGWILERTPTGQDETIPDHNAIMSFPSK